MAKMNFRQANLDAEQKMDSLEILLCKIVWTIQYINLKSTEMIAIPAGFLYNGKHENQT